MQTPTSKTLTRRKILLGSFLGALLSSASADSETPGEIVLDDVEAQTRTFMEWERSIQLDGRQEAIKKVALSAIPAPCCSDKSAYTCCCPCNMSRSIWGLANYMISKHGADATAVRAKAKEWIAYINPNGYGGKACYTGRCRRPFREDGCGGMNPSQLVF